MPFSKLGTPLAARDLVPSLPFRPGLTSYSWRMREALTRDLLTPDDT